MKRSYPFVVTLLALATVVACAPTGENESLFLYGNLLVGRKTQCVAKAGGGASVEQRSMGIVDLLMAKRYLLFPIIANQLQPSSVATGITPTELGLEANNITIKGFWVEYQLEGLKGPHPDYVDANGETPESTDLPKQWCPAAGTVPVNMMAPSIFEVIPPPIMQVLDADKAFDEWGSAGMMTVTVVLEGFLGDGTLVHSPEYHFPITVCRGCLLQYDQQPQNCCSYAFEPANYPCFPGQDDGYSCLTACWELDMTPNSDRAKLKKAMVAGYIDNLNVKWDELEPLLPEGFIKDKLNNELDPAYESD